MNIIITNSKEETQKIARDFSSKLAKGGVVALYGDLGSGKTTFVQGVAKGLRIKKRIISPTFIIVRTYRIKNYPFGKPRFNRGKLRASESRIKNLYHIDLYRTETLDDIKGLGLEEIISDPENIVVIEWAEKMKNLLPEKRIEIKFEYIDENKRRILYT